MIRRLRILLVAALLSAAGGAMAGPALFELAGDWRGVGLIRDDMDKPLREGRCRIAATPLVEGREVRLKGRCVTDRGSAEFSMRFVLYEGGVLAGGIATSLAPDSVQFIGQVTAERATLHSRETVEIDSLRGISLISLVVEDENHFVLRQSLQPEDASAPVELMQMEFSR